MRAGRMRAGELNRRVALQSVTRTPDGGGGAAETWGTYATVWAKVEPLTGGERFQAQQIDPALSHQVTIRYREGVSVQHRVLYGSRALLIESVADPEERHEALVIQCKEARP